MNIPNPQKRITNVLLIFFPIFFLACFSFGQDVLATYYINENNYYATGTLVSTNLLSAKTGIELITSFYYNASAIPASTTLKIQFATSSTSGPWYNSSGTLDEWNSLTATGGETISLSTLNWSGSNFYYKMEFSSEDSTKTPILTQIKVNYKYEVAEPEIKFVIDNSGNVGIGTDSPSEKLSIGGQGKLYWQDYGSGWFMEDTTFLQTISNKSVMVGDGNLEICSNGACSTSSYSGRGNLLVENYGEVSDGGIRLNTSQVSRPECSSSTQNLMWTEYGGLGEPDRSLVCLKSSFDEYFWYVSAGEFQCGDPVAFSYKGSYITYGTVNSTNTTCWMDRNLGASQVATASNDSLAYGDLFQWGRLDDGHQIRTSGTTSVLSTTDVPGHNNFIIVPDVSPWDWRSGQNNNLWQGVNGANNPCPSGWRVPTETEWNTEISSWSSLNTAGAYASPLKLTIAFSRVNSTGLLYTVFPNGLYWSSTVSVPYAKYLYFGSTVADMNGNYRAYGLTVRCLKD